MKCLTAGIAAPLLAALAGCGAPVPKDFSGDWTPVNRFRPATTAIPLSPPYTFFASPMDGTLRTLLARWAADNGLQLSYELGSDFALHQPVARIRTPDLQAAVRELSAIYAAQGASVSADDTRIQVQGTGVR